MGITEDLAKLGNKEKAKFLSGFFKTGPGQYGEGDIFLGITVPELRKASNKYASLSLKEIKELLNSKIHEHRLAALIILVDKYANGKENKAIFDFYISNAKLVNNWDLVDLSAHKIVGEHIVTEPTLSPVLYKLAKSQNLWEKRISLVSTLALIRQRNFKHTFRISEMLMKDPHDLIHKAVGWMLREVGKSDEKALTDFLDKHCRNMPRTSLRYAIERFSPGKKGHYMRK